MIGSQIKTVQEVGTQDRLANVGDDESEVKYSVFNANLSVREAIAGNV